MPREIVLNVVLLSGLAGFAVFCISYAVQVWRRRNANNGSSAAAPDAWAQRLRRGAAALLVAAAASLLLAFGYRELAGRSGRLNGDELLTVRARDQFRVDQVNESRRVQRGDVLVRFRSPTHQAKIRMQKLKRRRLRAERRIVKHEPLKPAPRLQQRRQNLAADARQLRGAVTQLLPAREQVNRARLQQTLSRRDRLAKLNTERARAEAELRRARAEHELHRKKLEWQRELKNAQAGSQLELIEQRTRAETSEARMQGLTARIERLEAEREQLREGMQQLRERTGEQAAMLGSALERTRERLERIQQREQRLAESVAASKRRARELRRQRLEKLAIRIRESTAELAGLREQAKVTAPFAGRVVFRDPAPQMVGEGRPLLVLAPGDGFRAQIRLPHAEVRALRSAGQVTLRLNGDHVQRRFPGELSGVRELPHTPGRIVATLSCRPPEQVVPALASGDERVEVSMLWRPPIWTQPGLPIGLGLLGLSMIFWGAGELRRRRALPNVRPTGASSSAEPAEAAAPDPATGNGAALAPVAAGAAAVPSVSADPGNGLTEATTRILGDQLRETLLEEELPSEHQLSALEWALDRHHERGVEQLSRALAEEPNLPYRVGRLLGGAELLTDADRIDRLIAVLRVVAPETVIEHTGRTNRKRDKRQPLVAAVAGGDEHGNGNGNGNGNGKG